MPRESRREPRTLFLLGGYTDKSVLAHNPAGGEGDGLYSVLFDPDLGKITQLKTSKVLDKQGQKELQMQIIIW